MSLSSVSSSTISSSNSTGSIRKSSSIKSSSEYRALRQQFFHLQSSHSTLKLVHEREMILASNTRTQLENTINNLQMQLDEIQRDQVFLLDSEQEALKQIEILKEEQKEMENSFKTKVHQLESNLTREQEAKFILESELKRLKSQNIPEPSFDISGILQEWRNRVVELTNHNQSLEIQVDQLKTQLTAKNLENGSNSDSNTASTEELRRKLLSTYVSLESAQSVLAQKKAEAEKLSARIGNIKVLEEKYRDAQIRIKRLEAELQTKPHSSTDNRPESPSNLIAADLKLIELTKQIGSLKESLALSSLNQSQLQSDLAAKSSEIDHIKAELDDSKKSITKLQSSIKVKDTTIQSLKEQLDSTVNLLTETLKKKK